MKYIALFVLIQLIQIPLFFVGIPICAILAALEANTFQPRGVGLKIAIVSQWPRAFWLWSNAVDGVWGPIPLPRTKWQAFYWTALRNPVSNFRLLPYVSAPGRPLWYRSFTIRGRTYYAKVGWGGTPGENWPMCSAGAGKGY